MQRNTTSSGRTARWTVVGLAVWMVLVSSVVLAITWSNARHRAVILMSWGLILIWNGAGGLAMWHWRDSLAHFLKKLPGPDLVKFVLVCVFLALLEEAVTTAMTNIAPVFGVAKGQAYITASANYFDVVLYHSVIVFVPEFIGWAVMLRFIRFSPFAVFLLFGMTGLLGETISFGPQNLGNFGMWIFVYGLMIWLPAYAFTPQPKARPPRWYHYPMAVVVPILFLPLIAITSPWIWLTPKHPPIHFPPIEASVNPIQAAPTVPRD